MDEFLATFEEQQAREVQRIAEIEANNVAILEHMSRR